MPRPSWSLLLASLAVALPTPALAQDPEAGRRLAAEVCSRCHGPEGNAVAGDIPNLAGQTARYLYLQLQDFKAGRRTDPLMSPVAAALGKDEMHAVADYLASRPLKSIGFQGDAARVARGLAKATETLCTMCHLGGFSGQNEIPRVAGQHPDYVAKQLRAFKARTRVNDGGNMTAVAQTLSDQDIVDLSEYVASLR